MIRATSIYLGRTQPEDGAYFYGLPRRRREGEEGGEEGEQSEVAFAVAAASSSGGDDDEVDSVHGELLGS